MTYASSPLRLTHTSLVWHSTCDYGTALAKGYTVTKTALAASQREWSGEYAMAKPHDTQNHEVFQEDPMVTELLAELQAMDEKARVEARFYELIAWISRIDGLHQNDRELPVEFSKWERRNRMLGFMMWLFYLPLSLLVFVYALQNM
jgi:hypothetical protein